MIMSPIANTSGCPGTVRSGSTSSLPAPSTPPSEASASKRASGDACTPAAQTITQAGIVSSVPSASSTVTDPSSTSRTRRPSSTETPSRSSARCALADSRGGNVPSTRSEASISRMRASRGSIARNSRLSVRRAISAICPAISTPVGPAPTTTNVNHRSRRATTCSVSAASNADSSRRRISSVSSSPFGAGASCSHSSCPKYEYAEPPATISVS